MANSVVSFEKTSGTIMKKNIKTRRIDVPGIIEREEIRRAGHLEIDAEMRLRRDRRSWYNEKCNDRWGNL